MATVSRRHAPPSHASTELKTRLLFYMYTHRMNVCISIAKFSTINLPCITNGSNLPYVLLAKRFYSAIAVYCLGCVLPLAPIFYLSTYSTAFTSV